MNLIIPHWRFDKKNLNLKKISNSKKHDNYGIGRSTKKKLFNGRYSTNANWSSFVIKFAIGF